MSPITGPAATETRCLRCRRVLRSAKSVADNYGPGCAAKIRKAAREHALDGLTAKQATEATEIAADGGVVEAREGVFRVVSGDGSQTYIATPDGHCTCAWGLRRTMADTKVCKHVGAVRLVISGRPAQSRTAFRTAAREGPRWKPRTSPSATAARSSAVTPPSLPLSAPAATTWAAPYSSTTA